MPVQSSQTKPLCLSFLRTTPTKTVFGVRAELDDMQQQDKHVVTAATALLSAAAVVAYMVSKKNHRMCKGETLLWRHGA